MNKATHPLKKFGEARGWKAKDTAAFFGLSAVRYSQLTGGHGSTTYERALSWEKRSRGEVAAFDVLEWQRARGRRGGRAGRAGRAA